MPKTAIHNGLSKAERLKSRKQTDALFAGGKFFFVHPIKVVYQVKSEVRSKNADMIDSISEIIDQGFKIRNDQLDTRDPTSHFPLPTSEIINHQSSIRLPTSDLPKIGVSASKRLFKKAVDRNRIKRLLRETYRKQKHGLVAACQQKGIEFQVFFIYTHKQLPVYAELLPKMHQCLQRLQLIVNQQPSENLLPK